ncbi:MAG: hypothetical protein APU95_05145 [Hadesarchaea archaeon YNP_N21]|nr:MAG: hypothetical protein APU95_05145 [Hadesarchaea archaeon YNP_N21]
MIREVKEVFCKRKIPKIFVPSEIKEWTRRDLNPQPPPFPAVACEGGAFGLGFPQSAVELRAHWEFSPFLILPLCFLTILGIASKESLCGDGLKQVYRQAASFKLSD